MLSFPRTSPNQERPQSVLLLVLATITASLAGLRFIDGGITTISLAISLAALSFFGMAIAAGLGFRVSAILIPIIASLTLTVLAFVEGGLWSDASIWFPFIPLVTVVVDEKRWAIPLFGYVTAVLSVLLVCHLTEFIAKGGDPILHFASLLGASVFGVSIALRVKQEHHEVKQSLMNEAQRDPLTGLLNRRGLERVTQSLTQGSVGVLFVDLDGLKKINDTLGHDEGDAAITDAADTIRASMRGSDLCARMGGDEFVIVMPEIKTENQAQLAAERLLKNLSLCRRPSKRALTGSVGASFTHDINSHGLATLIDDADRAMYRAKRSGGNASWMAKA